MAAAELPEGLLTWVASLGPGRISNLYRHVARREAWVVDVTRDDGSVLQGFLRIDRNPAPDSTVSLRREARCCEALAKTDIPVPALLGWNEEFHSALFARDPGRADIDKLDDAIAQRAIMEDFVRVIARLHRLEPEQLGLNDILGELPQTASACALSDVDAQLQQFGSFLDHYTDPLITYAVDWLRRNVPQQVNRVSLVQGDTGPVNFMFQGSRVSAVVDWEWGHWGDPMEDLGNICVREFWNPSGGLQGLFELYERESGIPYSREAAWYYRIQQNVRGMIPIHAVCQGGRIRESLAWYLCYRYVGDRSTCEALAEAMGIAIERPVMPDSQEHNNALAVAACHILEQDLTPALDSGFAQSRARDAMALIHCMARREQYGSQIAAIELGEISELSGAPQRDLPTALEHLDGLIRSRSLDDEALVQYLARRAYRDEWLHQPVVELYPRRAWSPIDRGAGRASSD